MRNALAVIRNKQMVVLDEPCRGEALSEPQLPLDHCNGSPAQFDPTVLMSLGAIRVDAVDARLGDTQDPVCSVVVGNDERDLFRWTQTGEESELVIVALGLAPIRMQRGDQHFRIVDAERINLRSVLLADLGTPQVRGWISLIRVVQVAKRKRAPQGLMQLL